MTVSLALALPLLAGCPADDPTTTDTPDTTAAPMTTGTPDTTTGDTTAEPTTADPPTSSTTVEPTTVEPETGTSAGDTETGTNVCADIDVPAVDEAACEALADDYQPRDENSANDTWPACVSDMGPYTLVDKTPSTIARVVAYEAIGDLLWRKKDPTADDFTAARMEYVLPEGIESRVVRREDLHYPEIPMADWDPQVDADKQCTVEANVAKYPDRCVGPAKMQPVLDDAFASGQLGEGDPNVLAERIHGSLFWFFYLSVYKEANTCATVAPKDCDSAWAYYTGGEAIEAGIGISAEIKTISENTHNRIHDGIMAVRCWRDLAQEMGMYPLLDAVDADSKALFEQGWEQLDQATHRGFVLVIRDYVERYIDQSCAGEDTAATWAFLQVAGPAMQREADERDAAAAATLADFWASDAPDAEAAEAAIAALDAIFPCP